MVRYASYNHTIGGYILKKIVTPAALYHTSALLLDFFCSWQINGLVQQYQCGMTLPFKFRQQFVI